MSAELDAAGIHDPLLRASYQVCRQLNASHGKTYFLATLLLPPAKRPHVHALYGFARYADDMVDDPAPDLPLAEQEQVLAALAAGLRGGQAPAAAGAAVLPAVRDTIARLEIPMRHFDDFLHSMRLDLTVTEYATYGDLERYMHGSAAAIGLQMLPVLGHPGVPADVVAPYASDLGIGFQLTNFIRDVGEDLRRGRLYLPLEDLERFGVDRARLERRVVDARVQALLRHEAARARELLRRASHGIRLVHPASRDCLRTALVLYGGILDAVERSGYRVLDRRARVGRVRRLAVAGPALVRARRARRQPVG